jgi:hypothetical protein
MDIYQSLPNNKSTVSVTFRLFLAQGFMEKHSFGVPHPAHSHPSVESPPKANGMTFPGAYSCHQKEWQKKIHGFSQQANYTDRATTACQ